MVSSKRMAQAGLGAAAAVFAASFAALVSSSADLPVSTVPTAMSTTGGPLVSRAPANRTPGSPPERR